MSTFTGGMMFPSLLGLLFLVTGAGFCVSGVPFLVKLLLPGYGDALFPLAGDAGGLPTFLFTDEADTGGVCPAGPGESSLGVPTLGNIPGV